MQTSVRTGNQYAARKIASHFNWIEVYKTNTMYGRDQNNQSQQLLILFWPFHIRKKNPVHLNNGRKSVQKTKTTTNE